MRDCCAHYPPWRFSVTLRLYPALPGPQGGGHITGRDEMLSSSPPAASSLEALLPLLLGTTGPGATPRSGTTQGRVGICISIDILIDVNGRARRRMMKSAQAPTAPAPYSLAASLALSCRLSPEQEAVLEASFQRAKNVDPVEMELLAAEMGVPEADVQHLKVAKYRIGAKNV
ncbi:Macrophage immunometabolism regulator [Frankliniella fusca]|uniref:Macrophage immunometabolism regulator n=1 Tax=Frankliniella fusca TaxID=407009 RepID=A0AAE1LTL0_9NEOP|nr:Macrophage immunometabolism regulator [Frankliniella fusca]